MMRQVRKTKRQIECEYFRAHEPYCANYTDTEYYFLNREYKNVGNPDRSNFVSYPELTGELKRVYFYNDGTNPYSGWIKRTPKKHQDLYHAKLNEFKAMVESKGLVERFDFKNIKTT